MGKTWKNTHCTFSREVFRYCYKTGKRLLFQAIFILECFIRHTLGGSVKALLRLSWKRREPASVLTWGMLEGRPTLMFLPPIITPFICSRASCAASGISYSTKANLQIKAPLSIQQHHSGTAQHKTGRHKLLRGHGSEQQK